MAKRRSKEQLQADKIIRQHLMELGEKVYKDAKNTSKVAETTFYKDGSLNREGGTLRDSINYRMINDTSLVCFQVYYGKWNTPKGEPTYIPREGPEFNALLISLNELKGATTKAIVADINETLLTSFKK